MRPATRSSCSCRNRTAACGTASCRAWVRVSATATASSGRTSRRGASAATPTSCSSIRMPGRSTATSSGATRSWATRRATRTATASWIRRRACRAAWSSRTASTGAATDRRRSPTPTRSSTRPTSRASPGCNPGVPEALRGTYAGLASPAALDHLRSLGVTAVELLPVHHHVDDGFLRSKGLDELLGLQHAGLLRPARRLLGGGPGREAGRAGGRVQGDGQGAPRGRHRGHPRRRLQPHRGGQPPRARRSRFRGLDNPTYYRLTADDPRYYFDTTGTGNSLNADSPVCLRLIMDSLRYWVDARCTSTASGSTSPSRWPASTARSTASRLSSTSSRRTRSSRA